MHCKKRNACDSSYNSIDVHFTSACDNRCAHCIDAKFNGCSKSRPDSAAIADTIIKNQQGVEDVLFLGGEPCLYLKELVRCVRHIKVSTDLKVFVTTSVPRTCYDNRELFVELINLCDGINLSVQHHNELIADMIRGTTSTYDRQAFYASLPCKDKIRINLNIVKPYLCSERSIKECLRHYDAMGFNSIKLSELQHCSEHYASFAGIFNLTMMSPYFSGCQQQFDARIIDTTLRTPILLKRSCFLCEETQNASLLDGLKVLYKALVPAPKGKYGVVYSDGTLKQGWV